MYVEKVDVSWLSEPHSLTIRGVNTSKSNLIAWIDRSSEIDLDIAADAEIDVAGVQLLHAARRYAEANGKRLKLSRPADGRLLQVLDSAGILDAASAETLEFWLHQGGAA